MSISGVSGQASSLQVSILVSQGRAAGSACDGGNDANADDGASPATGSADSAPGNSLFLSLAQQIQSTVDSAVQNLDPSSSNNPLDILNSILQALDKTLHDNASGGSSTTDPAQTASTDPAAASNATTTSDAAGGGQPATSNSPATTPDATNAASATGQTSLLDLLLGENNVDASQFKNDLLSALNGSQNGSVDFSVVFQSFPVGQAINAQA